MNFQNLKYAIVNLATARLYVLTIILTLGLTLGALVIVFNLVYKILAAPLPYPDQEQLYLSKGNAYKDGNLSFENEAPYPGLIDVYGQKDSNISSKALLAYGVDIIRNLPHSPRVNTAYATPEIIDLFDFKSATGRLFKAEFGLESYVPEVFISHAFWLNQYGGSKDVVGKRLQFGDRDFQIVGVLDEQSVEPQLIGPGRKTDIWFNWDYNIVREELRKNWGRIDKNQFLVFKLKDSASVNSVTHTLSTYINSRFKDETASQSFFSGITIDLNLVPLRNAILGDVNKRIALWFAGILALLLIAASNITNLVLARAAGQFRTMSIHAALGARKSHIFQAVFSEILLVLLGAAVFALLVAVAGIYLLKDLAAEALPRISEIGLDFPSVIFSFSVAIFLALFFSLLVIQQINFRRLQESLQASGKGGGLQVSGVIRKVLIVSQVSIAALLLIISVHVFTLSIKNLSKDFGFKLDDTNTVYINFGDQSQKSEAKRKSDLYDIASALENQPSISKVSITTATPIGEEGAKQWESFISNDIEFNNKIKAATSLIDHNYFSILGMEVVAGVNISNQDANNSAHKVIVNQTLARQFSMNDNEIVGSQFYWLNSPDRGKTLYEVVGVVRDLSISGMNELPRMFFPQTNASYSYFLVETQSGETLDAEEINSVLKEISGQYKVSSILPLSKARDDYLFHDAVAAMVSGALTILSLVLAAIGMFGVLRYDILMRRFELGIRMAIGAKPIRILSQVFKETLIPVSIGIVLALAALIAVMYFSVSVYSMNLQIIESIFPIVLIVLLAFVTTLASVWFVIKKPAINALSNQA